MTTKIIGIKEFRANIADYAKKAQKKTARYIVMKHNKPLFELKPFDENEGLEEFFLDIQKGIDDMKKGRVYTEKEIMKKFIK